MKEIYDSGLHHPLAAYVFGLLLLVALARRLPFLYAYLLIFCGIILADATCTGAYSPIPMGTAGYTFSSVTFIILGDLRYFLLAERVTRPTTTLAKTLWFSVPVSFIMPVTTYVMTLTMEVMRDDRVLYAVYELSMVPLVLGLDHLRFQRRVEVSDEVKRWVRAFSVFFATLYFGWGACDVILLLGLDVGHLLRVIPNVLYYAGFLLFVLWRAPESQLRLQGAPPCVS